jgi:ligand-binding SRPBCC domain-containing protein
MQFYRFEREQQLPIARQIAWDFFSDPRNLPQITPPSLGLRITSTVPAEIYAGLLISYQVSPFSFWQATWLTEITHVDPGNFFVDEQRLSPYRFWHHQHHFTANAGGILARDQVTYALPYYPFGNLVAGVVARELEKIFDFRRLALERLFP